MITIGLTGSIAMGKSEVAQVFRTEGIPVFDADAEVHALYQSPAGVALLQPLFPAAIEKGQVNRQQLSQIVLENPQRLEQLETIVHAEVAKQRNVFVAHADSKGTPIVVIDMPLLFEKGGEKQVDVTVVVSAPPQQQQARALARPGMTTEKLEMLLKRQMPDAEKRRLAHYVIINDGSLDDLRQTTRAVLSNIRKEHRL